MTITSIAKRLALGRDHAIGGQTLNKFPESVLNIVAVLTCYAKAIYGRLQSKV